MFENHRKSRIETLREKRATFTLWVNKSSLKGQKWYNLTSFWKPEACVQTVLPDMSILKGQKLVENANIKNLNATFWVFFKQCALAKNLEFDFLCRIKTSITQNCVYDVSM